MDTNRLKYFCVLAELESLSRAAELLNITHSGLHKSLKILEQELGFKITKPKGRGITLTDKAKNFYPKAVDILNLVEDSLHEILQAQHSVLRIGGLEVFTPFLANKISLDKHLGGFKAELHEFTPGELESALINKQIDYGLTYIPVSQAGLEFLKISRFQMGVICGNEDFKVLNFEEIPFVVPYAPLVRNPGDIKNRDGWTDLNKARLVKYKTNSLFTALQLVDAGAAVVYAPRFIRRYLKCKPYFLEPESKKINHYRDLYLVIREEVEENSETKKLTRLVRQWIKEGV